MGHSMYFICCKVIFLYFLHSINHQIILNFDCNVFSFLYRGFRNGVITGVRVRLPYIFQALIYAVIFREGKYVFFSSFPHSSFPHSSNLHPFNDTITLFITFIKFSSIFILYHSVIERVKVVLKQMAYHGRNLAMFVGIYKSVSSIFPFYQGLPMFDFTVMLFIPKFGSK